MWLLYDTDCIENIVESGESAQNEQFHFFPQCFPKAFFFIESNEYKYRKGLIGSNPLLKAMEVQETPLIISTFFDESFQMHQTIKWS